MAPAPTISNLSNGCPAGPTCVPNTTYFGSFNYTGPIDPTNGVEGWVTIDVGSPGSISNIVLDGSGGGTFEYHSGTYVGSEETIHIKLTGPGGIQEATISRYLF